MTEKPTYEDLEQRVKELEKTESKRKQAEEELRQSEKKFRSLFKSMLNGFALHKIVLDENGTPIDYVFIDTNVAFEKMTGLKRKDSIGRRVTEVLPGIEKDPVDWIGKYGKVALSGEEIRFENYSEILGKWFSVYAYCPIKDHFVAIFEDITERKKMEEEKEKLENQLRQALKMEAIGRLAGGVAHDFNNMLGVILGHAEMVLEKMDTDQPFYTELTEIKNAGLRSADLTRQLLAFARKQTVSPKVIDLNKTVAEMTSMLQRLIGEDIEMTWVPDDKLWPINIDPSQIDMILTNLCVNARDAIADVGKITIETGNTAFDNVYCEKHMGFIPGEYVLLAVSDNGCGMNPDTLENVFEPFFTTKEFSNGTGLGMSMIYGAVRQNHGFINIYSEPGQGTTIKIYLPRDLSKAVPLPDKGPDTPVECGHETILLVEDEPTILKMATRMLERAEYTVVAAGTPGEAIELARTHSGKIHLLMTDVVMPEMNGRDLARNILSHYPNIKCLFMSGYTANVITDHNVLAEGVNFIQKPFSIKDLTVKVREVLAQE